MIIGPLEFAAFVITSLLIVICRGKCMHSRIVNYAGHGSLPCDDGCIPDTVNHSKNVRELYEKAEDTNGEPIKAGMH